MSLLGLCGYARSGKDTAAGALFPEGWVRAAFTDALKQDAAAAIQASLALGGETDSLDPDPTRFTDPVLKEFFRPFLVEYGRALRRIKSDYWVTRLFRGLDPRENHVVTDVRYQNEVEAIHLRGGKVIMITRPGIEPANAEEEQSFLKVKPDYVIINSGTIADLHDAIRKVVPSLLEGKHDNADKSNQIPA